MLDICAENDVIFLKWMFLHIKWGLDIVERVWISWNGSGYRGTGLDTVERLTFFTNEMFFFNPCPALYAVIYSLHTMNGGIQNMNKDSRNEGLWVKIARNRNYMKCPELGLVMLKSDQQKALPQPPLCKEARGVIIEISADFNGVITQGLYTELLDKRRSERVFNKEKGLSQNQLAFLLWSTQGVSEIRGANYATLRPVPSGGARHPFETYFAARNIEGLEQGVYHYLPLEHIGEKKVAIEYIGEIPDHDKRITEMLSGQKWASSAPAVVFLSCVAYRAEWRYSASAHRVALIDLGHVGQNLMLSACAMGLGSCCIAAYDQKLCDKTLNLDGYEEYTVYACAVGEAIK